MTSCTGPSSLGGKGLLGLAPLRASEPRVFNDQDIRSPTLPVPDTF